jgi:hypothetical protein
MIATIFQLLKKKLIQGNITTDFKGKDMSTTGIIGPREYQVASSYERDNEYFLFSKNIFLIGWAAFTLSKVWFMDSDIKVMRALVVTES